VSTEAIDVFLGPGWPGPHLAIFVRPQNGETALAKGREPVP
jgi:hypothetical protein